MANILIIDDEEVIVFTFEMILEDNGYTTYSASTGKLAITAAQKEHIDLAIVDINLPDMKGEEIIFSINKIKPDVKFIIHTGSGDFQVSKELQSIGLTDKNVLIKPVMNINIIPDLINKLLV